MKTVQQILIFCFLLLACSMRLSAQNDVDLTIHRPTASLSDLKEQPKEEKKSDLLQRIAVGGTFSLQIGNYTNIEVAPDASFHFNKWVCAGLGGTYIFSRYKTSSINALNSHVWGVKAFVEGHFFNYVGLHVEYQLLNYDRYQYNSTGSSIISQRCYSNNLLLGGGLYQRSGRVSYYVMVFYNLSNQPPENNVLDVLVFRAGFSIFLR